jgi:hypothetical protein
MDEVENIEFNIEIVAPQATSEQLDRITRQLLLELKELHVGSIKLAQGFSAPEGTKSVDPVTLGAIAIAVLPSFLPKIVDTAQAWVLRGSNRTIKFKGKVAGQTIEFEGSSEEFQKLIDLLLKKNKKLRP